MSNMHTGYFVLATTQNNATHNSQFLVLGGRGRESGSGEGGGGTLLHYDKIQIEGALCQSQRGEGASLRDTHVQEVLNLQFGGRRVDEL